MEKKELLEALSEHSKKMDQQIAELKEANARKMDERAEALQKSIDEMEETRKKMQEQLDTLDAAQQKSAKNPAVGENFKSLHEAIADLVKSDEFQNAKKSKFQGNPTFELKVDSSAVTGDVNRTLQNLTVGFAPDRAMAFMPFLNINTIGQDKNRILWMDGAYTSNAGYVGEGAAATADAGTATEKGRELAKISAKLVLSGEMLEDFNYIASQFRMKMQDRAMLFADGEAYTGDGSDGVNPKHIYGIVGHSTAFNATTAGVTGANGVEDPNIGDLIDAGILQAEKSEQRGLNFVWMNPTDFFRLKKTKASDGQYLFVQDVNGNYTINGLRVVRSSKVTANTMTIADTSKIQWWWKRRPEIKFGQMNGTDFESDQYTAVMFMRCQEVVETYDKTALIHFSDINAALTAITKA